TQRIGIHGWSNPTTANSALQAAAFLGAGGFRLHDFRSFVQWYEAEPEDGKFVWFDRDVDDLAKRGYHMMATLCRPPLWAGREGDRRYLQPRFPAVHAGSAPRWGSGGDGYRLLPRLPGAGQGGRSVRRRPPVILQRRDGAAGGDPPAGRQPAALVH